TLPPSPPPPFPTRRSSYLTGDTSRSGPHTILAGFWAKAAPPARPPANSLPQRHVDLASSPSLPSNSSVSPGCPYWVPYLSSQMRSEEHTSELLSRFDLVCR